MVDMEAESMFASIIRSIFASLDSFVYKLLAGIYNIFFNVATADILKEELVKNLIGRIQIILGVIILFKLVISFFSGVVNPDSLNDQKKGFGSIIKRVVVVLVMLLMIVPLNIPGVNMEQKEKLTGMASWNSNMNTHGILFGSLYELQRRVLEENIVYKVINGNSQGLKNSQQKNIGESFAKDVLKTFLTVNVVYDGADFSDQCEGLPQDPRNTKCVCTRWQNADKTDADDDINVVFPVYFNSDSTIDMLLQKKVITAYCDDNSKEMSYGALQDEDAENKFEKKSTKFNDDTYALAYSYLWSTIIGALFCILMLSLTVDVAVRLFKLVLLQIISPIAILSYIDPSSEKTFKNWTKTLTETYLSVFIRIAIISFIVFIINNISLTGFGLRISTGFVGFVTKILIYFGLIMFAKEAPKFITQSLGIESKEGNGLFSGLGKLKTGIGATAAMAVGGLSSGRTAYKASQLSDEVTDKNTKHSLKNKAKAVMSGIINGTGTTVSTAKTYGKSKDHKWRTAMDKVNSANAYRLQNAEEGGTWWGKTKEQIKQDFTGDSRYSQLKREEKDLKDKQQMFNSAAGLIKNLDSEVDNEVKKKGLQTMIKHTDKKTGQNTWIPTNMKDIAAAWEKGQSTGVFELNGRKFASAAEFSKAQADAIDFAKDTVYKGTAKFANGADYTAPSKIGSMQASVKAIFSSNDYAISYDNSKGMVANMKNAADYLNNQSYVKEQELSQKQKEIATAQANVRGTDGHPGGK